MTIRNAIFDFGAVVVRWKPQEIIESFYADATLRALIGPAILQHTDWFELDRGTLDEAVAIGRFAQRTGRPLAEISVFIAHVRASLTPVPETLAIMRDLAERGIALYGLSNMASGTFAYLRERYDLWDAFRGIVISAHVKMLKPEPEIFEHIAREHALSPSETVFIDDHAPNVAAARQLGFHTILFESPQQCATQLALLLPRIIA
jgi:putative hydrolase of the HAD superfamily